MTEEQVMISHESGSPRISVPRSQLLAWLQKNWKVAEDDHGRKPKAAIDAEAKPEPVAEPAPPPIGQREDD